MKIREKAVMKITERCCQLFGKKPEEITENTRFAEDLGAKSGNISQMTTFLEDEFDMEVPYMEFRRRGTVGAAADFIVELCEEC